MTGPRFGVPATRPRLGVPAIFAIVLALLAPAPAARAQADASLRAGHAASASGDFDRAYRLYLEAWDPAADRASVLAALAGAASRIDSLPDLRDRLAPVVAADPSATNAARYWAAAALQTAVDPDSVQATLARRVEARPDDRGALRAYVGVWLGADAPERAEALLGRAEAAGAPPGPIGILKGEARESGGAPVPALHAYAGAIRDGDGASAGEALRRADRLLESWPGGPVPGEAVDAVDRVRAEATGPAAVALAALAVRAGVAAGRWDAALAAARDPAIGTAERASALRAVASAAGRRGAWGPAREAAAALVDLDPALVRPEDRALLAEAARHAGDPREAAEAARGAALPADAGPVERAEVALAAGDREALEAALADAAEGAEPSVLAVPRGDLWLARSRPDSAMAAYRRGIDAGTSRPAGLAALGRVRLLQALSREGDAAAIAAVGEALLDAPAEPATAPARLRTLASEFAARGSAGVAAALLEGLAGDWEGRAGDPAGASRSLERAARRIPGEAPALLLAAGTWAAEAGEPERARELWREVALDHATTPYALEARRLLAEGSGR